MELGGKISGIRGERSLKFLHGYLASSIARLLAVVRAKLQVVSLRLYSTWDLVSLKRPLKHRQCGTIAARFLL